jgi:phosphoglucosamine mutase
MTLQFGTDGVRGVANSELTPEFVTALARAAARVLGGSTVLVGRDTRRSGALMLTALSAGFCAEGVDVVDLGVLPTPAVALASVVRNTVAAMISASHNPFEDNGIKFFLAGGRKLDDAIEEQIEAELHRILSGSSQNIAITGESVGDVTIDAAMTADYVDAVVSVLAGRRLDGLKVVLDCANGATSTAAPAVFERLGASVTVIHATPNGVNINDHCGSTHPESLQAAVKQHGADMGFAFDGDADRMLAVDHTGELIDGDQLMAMMSLDMRDRGVLAKDTVVVTVMTNLGFKLAMQAARVNVVETKVGDRYVLEAIEEHGYSLGGEQSGHLILRDHATTGDGTLAAVMIADLVQRSAKPLVTHAAVMTRLPQVLKNVKGVDRTKLDAATELWDDVKAVEESFGGQGRVLIRPSGTEALVRVMVEASTPELANGACERLCATVVRCLSLA